MPGAWAPASRRVGRSGAGCASRISLEPDVSLGCDCTRARGVCCECKCACLPREILAVWSECAPRCDSAERVSRRRAVWEGGVCPRKPARVGRCAHTPCAGVCVPSARWLSLPVSAGEADGGGQRWVLTGGGRRKKPGTSGGPCGSAGLVCSPCTPLPPTGPEVINTTPSSLQPVPVTGRGAGVLRGWLRGLHGPLGQSQPPA